ncbi:MAG TPA: hypothetical protein PK297_12605 [Spirochaetota bacterium]|nr:hypothetical protein [Spirochaetota bacterium]
MVWTLLILFLFGGDFSAPEHGLPGPNWLDSRVAISSPAGLAAVVTNDATRLDVRLVALRRLDEKQAPEAGQCARVLRDHRDPVLRAAARAVLGEPVAVLDDSGWERALRAMPDDGGFSLVADFRSTTNLLDVAGIIDDLGAGRGAEMTRSMLGQLFNILYCVRIQRYAMVVVTNEDNQAIGNLVVADGNFSVQGLLQIVRDAEMTNDIEVRDGWTIVGTPLAQVAMRNDRLVVGFGNTPATMGRLVEGWFSRMRDDARRSTWHGDHARLSGGLAFRISGAAAHSLLSALGLREINEGWFDVRIRSFATGDFEVRFVHPGDLAGRFADTLRGVLARLPGTIPGLDSAGVTWLRSLEVQHRDREMIVRPTGRYDLRRFIMQVLEGGKNS